MDKMRSSAILLAAIMSVTAVFSGCGAGTKDAPAVTAVTGAAGERTAGAENIDKSVLAGNYDCVGVVDSTDTPLLNGSGEYLRLKEDGTGTMFFALDENDTEFPVTWTYENDRIVVIDPGDNNTEVAAGTYISGIIMLKVDEYIMVLARDTTEEWKLWDHDREQFDKDFLDGRYFVTKPAAETSADTQAQTVTETAANDAGSIDKALVGRYDCVGVIDDGGYALTYGDGEYLILKDDGTGILFFALGEDDDEIPITWSCKDGDLLIESPTDETDSMDGTFENGIVKFVIDGMTMVLAGDTTAEWKAWNTDKDKFDSDFIDGKYFGAKSYLAGEEGASSASPADVRAVYDDVLVGIANELLDPDSSDSNWVFEVVTYNPPAENNVGYLYKDINKDGTEELIICSAPEEYENVYAIYTCKNGKAVQILDGWSRNTYGITEDGHIINVGSSGAAYAIFGVFHINDKNDDLECDDVYFTEYTDEAETKLGIYHNTEGIWDVASSELLYDNTDKWAELTDGYKTIPLQPTLFTSIVNEQRAKIAEIFLSGSEDIGEPEYFTEWNTGITENGVRVRIDSNTIAEVVLVGLEPADDYGYSFNASELFDAQISPDKPVITTLDFPGSVPHYGLEVTDETGTRFYSIDMSGKDGSLELNKITVDNVEHGRG